jgi:acetate kinase
VNVLVANAGSSSVKLRMLDAGDGVVGSADLGPEPSRGQVVEFVRAAPVVDAVGHRIVHGGERFRSSVKVDRLLEEEIGHLRDMAPLHNGPALRLLELLGGLVAAPQVACFDTAFHATIPDAAALYAVPARWREEFGVRRFGFHGLSHRWAAGRASALLGSARELRVVTCHLGAGASVAAVRDGRSVDTTMGFTPNEGLVMATRSGSVDPGMLMWIQRRTGLDPAGMDHALEHESGLVGLAGSADMRVLEARAATDPEARAAIAVYLHRLRAAIASMAAAMDGVDALVFTGGVGENSAHVRSETVRGLAFLGVSLDEERNAKPGAADVDLAARSSGIRVLLVRSREDVVVAGEVRALLA